VRVSSFSPWPHYFWGKFPQYPSDMRMGGTQGWSGHCGEHKNLSSLPGIGLQFRRRPAHSLVNNSNNNATRNKHVGRRTSCLATNIIHRLQQLHVMFLDLASRLCVRSMAESSIMVVAAALWYGRRVMHCNPSPFITHTHSKIIISVVLTKQTEHSIGNSQV
jgi:hypothetical protein